MRRTTNKSSQPLMLPWPHSMRSAQVQPSMLTAAHHCMLTCAQDHSSWSIEQASLLRLAKARVCTTPLMQFLEHQHTALHRCGQLLLCSQIGCAADPRVRRCVCAAFSVVCLNFTLLFLCRPGTHVVIDAEYLPMILLFVCSCNTVWTNKRYSLAVLS